MKRIPVYPLCSQSSKRYALVDDADYDAVRRYRWFAMKRNDVIVPSRFIETAKGMAIRTLHAEVMGKAPSGMVIDHINRKPLDCRRENLRICTIQQNALNRGPRGVRKYSRYKGVDLAWRLINGIRKANPKPWSVRVLSEGKRYWRGMFADEKEAYDVSVEMFQKLHGEFACILPWEGYSDTPALRKVLGRKNGPPPDRQNKNRANPGGKTTTPIHRNPAPHTKTKKSTNTNYTGVSFIIYFKQLIPGGEPQLIHGNPQIATFALFALNRQRRTEDYFDPLAPGLNQVFTARQSLFALAPPGSPEFGRGREPPEKRSSHCV